MNAIDVIATGASSAVIAKVVGLSRRQVRKAIRHNDSAAAARFIEACDAIGERPPQEVVDTLLAAAEVQHRKRFVQQIRDRWLQQTELHRLALEDAAYIAQLRDAASMTLLRVTARLAVWLRTHEAVGPEYVDLCDVIDEAKIIFECFKSDSIKADAKVFKIYDEMCVIANEAKKVGVYSVHNPRLKEVKTLAEQHRARCKARKDAKRKDADPSKSDQSLSKVS